AARAAEAAERYGHLRTIEVKDNRLARFLTRPAFRRAYERARQIAANAGEELPPIEAWIDEQGRMRAPMPMQVIDEIKRGLDDVLAVGRRSPLEAGGLGPA